MLEKIFDIAMASALGMVLLAVYSFLLVKIDSFFEMIKKPISTGLFNLVVWTSVLVGAWVFCYGIGTLFIQIFFR